MLLHFYLCPIYNGRMQNDGKNQKDTFKDTHLSLKDSLFSISYSKTNKLLTALYMVTEIIDKTEPIRHKLRSLATDLLSDTLATQFNSRTNVLMDINKKITEIMSFMDIASTIGMISEMNNRILKNEFMVLKKSLNLEENSVWLEEFLAENTSIGHGNMSDRSPIRIGVQKGEGLLTALKKIDNNNKMSNRNLDGKDNSINKKDSFNQIKLERRYEIMASIGHFPNGATISDIRSKGQGILKNMGEKTLQRELVSLTADGVLERGGEKRWSKYRVVPSSKNNPK